MKAVPVETINKIIDKLKNDSEIALLKVLIETHTIDTDEEDKERFISLVSRIRARDPNGADWLMGKSWMMILKL